MMIRRPASHFARVLSNGWGRELYLTAAPTAVGSPGDQARDLYSALRAELIASGARIFAERLFATQEAMATIQDERRAALDDLDDGVSPTRVVVAPGRTGPFAGVQIHAVAGESPPTPLLLPGADGLACGRELRTASGRWLTFSELTGGDGPPGEQARRMFDGCGRLLRQAGADMRSVVRTWLWLKDVCGWYADFNAIRTAFFERERLIHHGNGRPRLPASTGIGLGVAGGAACALDLIAVPGAEDRIELLEAGGHQNSAFAYGSAFSRAAIAPTPGGRTLFVSGTAAIDAHGRTEHVGAPQRQIEATVAHVRALLTQAGCGDEHVLSAVAYCKTAEVEDAFRAGWASLTWPTVSVIGEVCRPELLFEVELTAGVPTIRQSTLDAPAELPAVTL